MHNYWQYFSKPLLALFSRVLSIQLVTVPQWFQPEFHAVLTVLSNSSGLLKLWAGVRVHGRVLWARTIASFAEFVLHMNTFEHFNWCHGNGTERQEGTLGEFARGRSFAVTGWMRDVKAWSMSVCRGQYFLRIIAQAIWCWQKPSCSANVGKIIIKVKFELRQWWA